MSMGNAQVRRPAAVVRYPSRTVGRGGRSRMTVDGWIEREGTDGEGVCASGVQKEVLLGVQAPEG